MILTLTLVFLSAFAGMIILATACHAAQSDRLIDAFSFHGDNGARSSRPAAPPYHDTPPASPAHHPSARRSTGFNVPVNLFRINPQLLVRA